jgi:hypothetical protein
MTTDQLNALKARIEARKAKAAANKAAPATVTPIRPVLSPSACRPEPARTGLDVITPGVRFLRRNAYVAAVLYVPTHELTGMEADTLKEWLEAYSHTEDEMTPEELHDRITELEEKVEEVEGERDEQKERAEKAEEEANGLKLTEEELRAQVKDLEAQLDEQKTEAA